MKNQKEEREGLDVFVYPDYTNQELKELEGRLEEYKIVKNIDGKEYTFYNETKWYQHYGALGPNGGIILGNSRPVKFELMRYKLEQLYKFQGRREYAQKMNNQETKQD